MVALVFVFLPCVYFSLFFFSFSSLVVNKSVHPLVVCGAIGPMCVLREERHQRPPSRQNRTKKTLLFCHYTCFRGGAFLKVNTSSVFHHPPNPPPPHESSSAFLEFCVSARQQIKIRFSSQQQQNNLVCFLFLLFWHVINVS